MRKLAICLMLIGMTACARGSGGDAKLLWCNTNHPIVVTQTQWDGLSDAQQQQILGHNEYGRKICGKEWAKI